MRVLWFVNIPFPEVQKRLGSPAGGSGWWMVNLAEEMKRNDDIELGVVHFSHEYRRSDEFEIGGIRYYCEPSRLNLFNLSYSSELERAEKIVRNFGPDIINVHGTEFFNGLITSRTDVPAVVTIQGFVGAVFKHYFAEFGLLGVLARQFRGLNDIKSLMLTMWNYLSSYKGKLREEKILRLNSNFIGRTAWDYQYTRSRNPKSKYYLCHEILRPKFRQIQWDISKCERQRIVVIGSQSVAKGIHLLIKVVPILREKYTGISVRIAGVGEESSWGRYLRRFAEKMGVGENIILMGYVNEERILEEFLKANVYVCSSYIENSPNSLGEAMSVGMPCIATETGGIPSMMRDEIEGLLFSRGNAESLAEKLKRIFDNDNLAIKLGHSARTAAMESHSPEKVLTETLCAYKDIIDNWSKRGND